VIIIIGVKGCRGKSYIQRYKDIGDGGYTRCDLFLWTLVCK
jgi:hypothetical protein